EATGPCRRRIPAGHRYLQGPCPGRQRHLHRPALHLGACRLRPVRGGEGAGHPHSRARVDDAARGRDVRGQDRSELHHGIGAMTRTVNVLVIQPIDDAELAQIARLDPCLRVVDARGWFDDEYRDTWPQWSVDRYLGTRPCPPSTRAERDRLLAEAEVLLGGWPFPLDLGARASRLRWFHQRPAGASNLLRGDLWGSDVVVTTSRGFGSTRAMAEYVLACFVHFARGLHRAHRDRQRQQFEHGSYRPVQIEGK